MFGRRNTGSFACAMLIAGLAWFVLYAGPAAKFPPSPLALFKGEAAAQYYPLYFGYLAVSGLAALGIVLGFRKARSKNKILGMAAVHFVVIAIAFLAFPNYGLDSTIYQKLVNYWRASVSAAYTAFWFSAGAIAGLLWKYGSATNKA